MTVCGEKVTGVCVVGKCPHFKRCHPIVWDKYGKIKPKTNEEWFCQLPTEEKARWLYDHYVNARADEYYGRQEKTLSEYQKWLVSVHRKIDGTKID